MEEFFEKYNFQCEDIQDRLVVFKEPERRGVDFEDIEKITVDSVILTIQDKESGNENNKKEYHQVNSYNKNEAIKSQDKKASKKKVIMRKILKHCEQPN